MSVYEKLKEVELNCSQYVYGQDELIRSILAALVCEGHVLIEGMPGLAKTFTVNVMSKLCELAFKRVQFTPDLLPSDLIGTMIFNQAKEEFTTKFGPVFTQILLADEINRAPAKVQAALLEAMAERQVTIGEESYQLSSPFVVLATQNPIDQEGTYKLPEAQLDRFMMKVMVDYPNVESEMKVLDLPSKPLAKIEPVLSTDLLIDAAKEVKNIYVDKKVKEQIIRIVHATRPGSELFLKKYQGVIQVGASPRASIWLQRLGQFTAYMEGKSFVTPDHLLSALPSVLGHRVILSYEAQVDHLDVRKVVIDIAKGLL